MTKLTQKIANAASSAVLFAAACIMAVLGFAFLGGLALFALLAVGVAMVVSPFAMRAQRNAAATDGSV